MAERWLVVFAIDDLKSIPSSFCILDVTYFKFDKAYHAQWKLLNDQKLHPSVVSIFLDKNCASTEVEANSESEALNEGAKKIQASIDVMRVFKSNRELRRPLNGLVRNLSNGKEGMTLYASWYRDKCAPWKFELDQKELSKLTKSALGLEQVLASLASTIMGRRIFRALSWAAMATQEVQSADKIIKFTTAIECLFIKERHNKANLAAERVAMFWTTISANRDKIFSDIHRFYQLRNNIVHGENFSVSKTDEAAMDRIVRELVFAVAEEVVKHKLLTFEDFLAHLETFRKGWSGPSV